MKRILQKYQYNLKNQPWYQRLSNAKVSLILALAQVTQAEKHTLHATTNHEGIQAIINCEGGQDNLMLGDSAPVPLRMSLTSQSSILEQSECSPKGK